MKTPQITKQFKKDVKRLKKQGKDLAKMKTIIDALCLEKKLDLKYRDHLLVGNYSGSRECHLEPDWLLIYESSADRIKLQRTGSHAELFNL